MSHTLSNSDMEKMGSVRSNDFGTNVTPSSKYQYFILPSGAVIDICYHTDIRQTSVHLLPGASS